MKKLTVFILLLLFTGQTFSQGLYCLDYLVRRTAYEKHCVNKARPMLKCHGKCQLMKKIQEEEQRQQQQAPELKQAAKAEFFPDAQSLLPAPPSFLLQQHFGFQNSGMPVDQPATIFHPPGSAYISC